MNDRSYRGVLIAAATLLGVGLGGFMEGIVFHQILQWHNMMSSVVEPNDLASMKYNMMWDGMFHAFTWIMTVVGLTLLWRAGQRTNVPWSTRTFVGSLGLGWGLFNLVEGVMNHHILRIHHVHSGPNELAWDLAYLGFGALLAAVGWGLIRAGRHDQAPRGAARHFGPGPTGTSSGSLAVRSGRRDNDRKPARR